MLYLMELPIKDELHVHLARLTGVVDTIAEISKLNKKQVSHSRLLILYHSPNYIASAVVSILVCPLCQFISYFIYKAADLILT